MTIRRKRETKPGKRAIKASYREIMDLAYDINNYYRCGVVTGLMESIKYYRNLKRN